MAKTAIMTGASRGIGREIAKRLAADECSVVVNYSENSAKADELCSRNVTANVIAPGPVAAELFRQGKTQEQIMRLSKLAPMERLGEALDIARVVSFLAEPDGGWVNAQILGANGGYA
ncbi:MAG: SDR family oxidoreductase [Komarekiella atlantica HA4396-MV6]|jgi:NAD(P)-dependent dehydrogenase (short-subunit alcohol dehydrogenase family)|nr:SDR family oxidoreductase [Komarekiella atlantica HA4396-MV6]